MQQPTPLTTVKFETYAKRLQEALDSVVLAASSIIPDKNGVANGSRDDLVKALSRFELLCDEIYLLLDFNKKLQQTKTIIGANSVDDVNSKECVGSLAQQLEKAKQVSSLLRDFRKDLHKGDSSETLNESQENVELLANL